MNFNKADVVCMRFPVFHFLHSIVIVNTQTHIIRACNNPLLSDNELGTPNWICTRFKTLDHGLSGIQLQHVTTVDKDRSTRSKTYVITIVPYVYISTIKGSQDPWILLYEIFLNIVALIQVLRSGNRLLPQQEKYPPTSLDRNEQTTLSVFYIINVK